MKSLFLQQPGSMRRARVTAACLVCLAASVGAQSHLVIPPGADVFEANGAEFWAAGPFSARRQIVLDAGWLVPAVGRSFSALAMRRNQGTTDDNAAGRLVLEVVMGHALLAPTEASAAFAANRGPDATRVYAGVVSFPAAPPAPSTPAPWSAPFAVELPFLVPFPYIGGPLVVETVTRPLAGPVTQNPWWPIDAAIGTVVGNARTFGTGCFANGPEPAAGADGRTVCPGATAVFWLRGQLPAGPAMCLLGGSNTSYRGLPLPLDLTPVGMTGCSLYNDIVVTLPALLSVWSSRTDGLATVDVKLPSNAALAGASLFGQWLVPNTTNGPLQLGTSNGVELIVGALPNPPGAAWIEGIGPSATTGRVRHDRCPVLRLDYLR